MEGQIQRIKQAIGAFFRQRRESIGWSLYELRTRTGTSSLQIEKMETGRDTLSTDTFFRVMLELGIGLHLTEQNSDAAAVTVEGASLPPPFLVATDKEQLYVLHWQHPAYLVQVVQTVPLHYRLVCTYGPTSDELKQHKAWKELDPFLREYLASTI